jgi:hypothetical protein
MHDLIAAISPNKGEGDSQHGMRCWSAGQTHTKDVRSDWNSVKVDVMLAVNRSKYAQHDDLRAQLLGTGAFELRGAPSTGWVAADGVEHNWCRWNGVIQMIIREELRPDAERRRDVLDALLSQIASSFSAPALAPAAAAATTSSSSAEGGGAVTAAALDASEH